MSKTANGRERIRERLKQERDNEGRNRKRRIETVKPTRIRQNMYNVEHIFRLNNDLEIHMDINIK